MNTTMKTGARLCAAWAACFAGAAFAQQVDEKCFATWHEMVAAQTVASQCALGDANTVARMKRVEDNSLTCAVARLSATEQAEVRASAAKTKAEIQKQMAGPACPPEAKAYFQERSAKMPSPN
jgi:hypothetical protein